METPKEEGYTFAFVFLMASGHINPSFPVARALVAEGHKVHYLGREQMREAIEDTGATFHNDIHVQMDFYEGRDPSLWGALGSLQQEHQLKGSMTKAFLMLNELAGEQMLPSTLRWLREIRADAVFCDPMWNYDAMFAAKVAKIPCLGLLTFAGPGCLSVAWPNILNATGSTPAEVLAERQTFEALQKCQKRLEMKGITFEETLQPMGMLPASLLKLTLVTTSKALADPMPLEMEEAYTKAGHDFVFVGPLLDKAGATHAAGRKFHGEHTPGNATTDVLSLAKAAKLAGRQVVLVSLGTILTGDHPEYGWRARCQIDGQATGASCKELCQSTWSAVFNLLGSDQATAPLILVSLGPQEDALDHVDLASIPPNVVCEKILPQVDLMRLGVDVFVHHGGQNSFMEALSFGIPMVVCPGWSDQLINGAKAESLKVGLKVDRPMGKMDVLADELKHYRHAISRALNDVLSHPSFRENAAKISSALRDGETPGESTGVPLAMQLLVKEAQGSKIQRVNVNLHLGGD